jgi:hypothetical protein
MEDLDKQLQGMKQNVTGTQVWNESTTSYYQASGNDPYDYACGKHKADSFFNADGDLQDLNQRLANALNLRVSLNSIKSTAQSNYDAANNRNPCATCYGQKDQKTADKKKYASDVTNADSDIRTNEANIIDIKALIETEKIKIATDNATDLAKKEQEAKRQKDEADAKANQTLANKGISSQAVIAEAKAKADALIATTNAKIKADALVNELTLKSSSRNKVLIIGGAFVLIAVFGVLILRKN